LQALHDHFVPYDEGKKMYTDLKDTAQRSLTRGCDQSQFYCLQNMPGGHVWGFIQAFRLLPLSILDALAPLKKSAAFATTIDIRNSLGDESYPQTTMSGSSERGDDSSSASPHSFELGESQPELCMASVGMK
jgi:hypothetical protein